MFARLHDDIRVVFDRDPAARSAVEVLVCYPGLHAIWFYRLATGSGCSKLYFLGRLVSHLGRWLTGIEIHPGATIGATSSSIMAWASSSARPPRSATA